MIGVITEFDDDGGYGRVASGGEDWFFHCTAIVDGSRAIEVGTEVRFEVVPGRRGLWEGSAIEPISPG